MAARICELITVLLIWIVAAIFPIAEAQQLPYENFRCNNGKYIRNYWFCDGSTDCDGSDESFGCSKGQCGPGQFTCTSDLECLDVTSRCNTIYDCADHSDELNCAGDETNIVDCSLHEGKFLCMDKLRCLDYNYTCDGICHCFDCSDENGHCGEIDTDSCRSCSHFCLTTPNGPQCPCNAANYEYSEFCKKISKEIENCTGSQRCEQSCSVYRNRTRCLCYENFHELPGSRNPHPKCKSDELIGSVLLYSTLSKIKSLNLTYSKEVQTIQRGFNHANNIIVLTGANNYTYYTSFYHKKFSIFKTSINDGKTDLIIQSSSSITSLSVDWITQNIYFTSNGSLSVCTNDGKICTQLECDDDADNVALLPEFGQMYFSKKSIFNNERYIIKSSMDGSEKNFLVDASFVDPLSLVIDEQMKILYVYELNTELLYSILLLEFNKEVSMELQLKKFNLGSQLNNLSFAAFDNLLFFSNRYNVIFSVSDIEFNKRAIVFHTDLETNAITNLYAYNPRFQRIKKNNMKNPCENVSCYGLCLLRPIPSTNQLNFTCMCQNDSPTNGTHWCNTHSAQPDEAGNSTVDEKTTAVTEKAEHGITTQAFQNSSRSIKEYVGFVSTQTDRHPVSMDSASTAPEQYSKSDIILAFMSGVALILGVIVLYFIFEKVSSNRFHRQVGITELMDIQ